MGNADGDISRAEFNSFMLVAMGKIQPETIEKLRAVFNRLDKNGDGKLSVNDLVKKIQYDLGKSEHKPATLNITGVTFDKTSTEESSPEVGDYSQFNQFPPNW